MNLGSETYDPSGVGPAPRTLGPERRAAMFRWFKNLYPLWLGLAIFFGVPSIAMGIALSGEDLGATGWLSMLFLPGVLTFAAARAWRARQDVRDRLVETYEKGELLNAMIGNVNVLYRGRYATYNIEVRLPNGKTARLQASDPSVDFVAQPNMAVEVIWYERNPDTVIPTLLLPPEY